MAPAASGPSRATLAAALAIRRQLLLLFFSARTKTAQAFILTNLEIYFIIIDFVVFGDFALAALPPLDKLSFICYTIYTIRLKKLVYRRRNQKPLEAKNEN